MLSLKKNQPETLTDITTLQAGVAWKTSSGGQKGLMGRLRRAVGTDLDLAAVALEEGRPKRICWFDNADAFDDGSLITLGDNRSGKGDGDDETIIARLDKLPDFIDTVVFIVSAFKQGVSFSNVEGVTLNVYDGNGGRKLGSYLPDIDSRNNACVMVKARRAAGPEWEIAIVNEMGHATSREQLLHLAKQHAA
ncbi:Stress response protein SCP2 [Streptomyces sp. YIM 121038]|uniref:TerD family protein n=1 Tax=Streptomyces sp. YIM 121038 TaxID=2136401 RepID=UPI0011643BDC|nr:TerD family protein [Streptomyces sp. YIM 121038]QCX81175.1 Stress response protein SCP2 [Streptomyces sp. YIM 121038]